jgi:hypothetical protein
MSDIKNRHFDEFLDFVKWMHEEYVKYCKSNEKEHLEYEDYINERFEQLCSEFHERVIH